MCKGEVDNEGAQRQKLGSSSRGSEQQLSFDGCSLGARYSGVRQSKAAAYDVIRPTSHTGKRHATRIFRATNAHPACLPIVRDMTGGAVKCAPLCFRDRSLEAVSEIPKSYAG